MSTDTAPTPRPPLPPLDPADTRPRLDTSPHGDPRISYGWSPAALLAVAACRANLGAVEILNTACELRDRIDAWFRAYGDDPDPGLTAIRAAGVPVPEYVAANGTGLATVEEDFRGLAWLVNIIRDLNEGAVIDPEWVRDHCLAPQTPAAADQAGQREGSAA